MEILRPEQYGEYESFAENHPNGGITQSIRWHSVKNNWDNAVVVSRDKENNIIGGISVLIRKIPLFGVTMLYAPRGPVCDLPNKEVMADLKKGIDALAKKHKAYIFKMDPDISVDDSDFSRLASELGFRQYKGGTGFETIQARFNYRLYLNGRSEDELLMNLTQQTRRNVRIAQKKGVEVQIKGTEALDDFIALMRTTGERDGFSIRPKVYFQRMLDGLGEKCRLYMAYYDGKPVAGAISTNYAGKTCYIYGASSNEHRNVMSTYLLQWEMIRWAAQTGCTVYDFQGVSGDLDENNPLYGLYRFKKGFNGTLDELAGEFDYFYRPVMAKLIDASIGANEWLRKLKRK